MYVEDGRTVKDICQAIGISDMTLLRWRRRYPDFDEQYINAVKRQHEGVRALRKLGVRTYRRNAEKLQQTAHKRLESEKIKQKHQKLIKEGKPLVHEGFLIRYNNVWTDDNPFEPCVNYSNGSVEYLKRKGSRYIQVSLSVGTFKRAYPAYYRQLAEKNAALIANISQVN